jgi:cyclopropane fatty-acyl-phospholipid synthase-like methyltransferase
MPVTKWIPESLKAPIRGSSLFRAVYHPRHAARLARTTKRLDQCAAQLAHMLHLAGDVRLEGARCLELGAGWVLTHALVCHLLGAERVVAVDVEAAARFESLRTAVMDAPPAIVRDLLAPFSDHADVRARLERLRAIERFDEHSLAELGIVYRAPIDLARDGLPESFDVIYSLSVLEHVPLDDVPGLLSTLTRQLAPDGVMLHMIHLEDHRDIARDPFAFLRARPQPFSRIEQTERGNRMRASAWLEAFARVPELRSRVLWAWQRREAALPDALDAAVVSRDEDDLRTSHLGIAVRRERGAQRAKEGARS